MDDTKELIERLQDPNVVHMNILGGGIARPTLAQIIHIYRPEAVLQALKEYNWDGAAALRASAGS